MDSTASFKDRATAIGLVKADLDVLERNNLCTFGQFSFLSSYQPGSSDETPFVDALTKVLGHAIDAGQLAGWRRLFFESHTLTMSDLKARLERKDDEAPRKLLMPERVERLDRARKDLVGITIDTQLEPAHRLVDLTVQQAEESTIRYIPLKDCLSRESELMHSKSEQAIEFNADGAMRLSKRQQEIKAEVTGDLKVKMALQRRALAYHLAGLGTYQKLDALIQRMYALMTREPVKGFRAVTLQQIINADREMWLQAAQQSRGKTLVDPTRPLDAILEKVFESHDVSFHLLPLPVAQVNQSSGESKNAQSNANRGGGNKRKFASGDKPAAKKAKGAGKNFDLPPDCVAQTGAGLRICFQYNRGRCNHQNKDKCERGLHVCWRRNCAGKHPHTQCEMA